jgi:type I restriction enzyme S subunit
MMKKLRFKNNNKQYPEPRLVKLSEVLVEGSKVKVYDTSKYKKITVMLNLKGLKFAEIDRDMADTRPFYQRRTNEIIIGKQNYFNGSIAIVSDEFNDAICSNAIMSFSSKQNNPFFLFSLLSQDSFMKQREKLANGTGQKELSENDFLSFEIKLPVIDEQEKIGGFLSTFNKLIQKQQEKIGLLKELKKGYLQKMFPKNDANVPEIRFKGFTDDWEQCELGGISDVTKLAGFEFTEYVEYSDNGKIIALRGLNVKNNSLVLDDVKYIDCSDFSK